MDQNNYSWGHTKRYNDFSSYFKSLFTERVQKVSVDAGFTCPNRDGTRGWGGCHYCNNNAFTPSYCNPENSVTDQIRKGIKFFERKYESMKYLAYFQAFTNTYAPLEKLKILYEDALNHPKLTGLEIATRPYSLSEKLLDFLA